MEEQVGDRKNGGCSSGGGRWGGGEDNAIRTRERLTVVSPGFCGREAATSLPAGNGISPAVRPPGNYCWVVVVVRG
ncbi:hypothetical protein E2562_003769 [Oryza meyeriana var. granulata]|uniref:Uncharacterized protein n=1 Tax=Oryza meyeriana var. granulata TaxID=110450 RepID=A0A6G1BS44_9ORYZ|nr:hypothetical protein E2562_003769 [Oryza meyeriana var. granulata]